MANGLLPFGSSDSIYAVLSDRETDPYTGGGSPLDVGWKATAGAHVNPSISTGPNVVGFAQTQDFFWDFYFRIWIFPEVLEMRNPRPGVDIPFAVWNAFPYRNNLTSIVTVDADGLELDVVPPSLFYEIEYRTINLNVLPTAPLNIDAFFTFNFERGSGVFHFLATRSSSISIVPEVPVKEFWRWKTDVTTAVDGTEQRVALRGVPRRYMENRLIVTSIEKVRDYIKKMMFDFAGQVLMPYFQYATTTTADSPLGTSILYFDSSVTDVRNDEFALLIVITTQGETVVQIQTLGDNSSIIDAPLDMDIPAGSLLVPAFPSLITSKPGMSEYAVDGVAEMTLNSMVTQQRTAFPRPGNTVTLTTFDGMPVLERRFTANNNQIVTQVDTGTELIDYDVGTVSFQNYRIHAQMEGERAFLVDRIGGSTDMDYWRNFLDAVRGRLNPFLLPTYREDVVLAEPPEFLAVTVTLVGTDYGTMFAGMETHSRLCFFTAAGPLYYRATDVVQDEFGNDVVTLDRPYASGDAGYLNVSRVSFLLKCRLGNDEVRLEHHHINTQLNLTIRTTDQ